MKQKALWVGIGAFLCFSCVTMMSSFRSTHSGGAANITTSADGKYVYIIGWETDSYFRSEDFGNTFENFDIYTEK